MHLIQLSQGDKTCQGVGSTAGLLAAIEWLLRNHVSRNIRVVNMSIGLSPVDSYRNNPICRGVRRLVSEGMVVVVAAGKEGKSTSGQKLYGSIQSPGIEPSPLTVGAANMFQMAERSDDAVASYSSRGPTRGARVDSVDRKHFDNVFKPEVVGPGNKLVYAEADGNLLVTLHPELESGLAGEPTNG